MNIRYILFLICCLPFLAYGQENNGRFFIVSKHSINTPFVFGLKCRIIDFFSLEGLMGIPTDDIVYKEINDCKRRAKKPENTGYNALENGNFYASFALVFNEESSKNTKKPTLLHAFEFSYKRVDYDVTYYHNWCAPSGLYKTKFKNKNEIFSLQYRLQFEFANKTPIYPSFFFSIGGSNYIYSETQGSLSPTPFAKSSDEFIKGQFDLGIIFNIRAR